jgi:hypothetical protein
MTNQESLPVDIDKVEALDALGKAGIADRDPAPENTESAARRVDRRVRRDEIVVDRQHRVEPPLVHHEKGAQRAVLDAGDVKVKGVVAPEGCIDPEKFLTELLKEALKYIKQKR